jgi:hypothetical protein
LQAQVGAATQTPSLATTIYAAQTPSGAARPNLIIRGNTISGSGYGIYIGPSKAWESALITNNLITGNGDGIYIVNRGIQILANQIQGNIVGVKLNDTVAGPTGLQQFADKIGPIYLGFNDINGNREYGLLNLTLAQVEAHQNWWGSASGPAGPSRTELPQTEAIVTDYALVRLDGSASDEHGLLEHLLNWAGLNEPEISLAGLARPAELSYGLYSRPATIGYLLPAVYVSVVNKVKRVAAQQPMSGDAVQGKVDTDGWLSTPIQSPSETEK